MHSLHVFSSSNILLDEHMRAKMGDFGFAMTLPEGRSYIWTSEERQAT